VRRSTTLVTWPRARNSSLRSMTSFMYQRLGSVACRIAGGSGGLPASETS
jgi:hypothetical protein